MSCKSILILTSQTEIPFEDIKPVGSPINGLLPECCIRRNTVSPTHPHAGTWLRFLPTARKDLTHHSPLHHLFKPHALFVIYFPMKRLGRKVAISGKRKSSKAQAIRLNRKGSTPL